MKFNIDCHLHPNLPRNEKRAAAKCKKWWEKIGKIGINAIIVTEHCYNNPKETFLLMEKTAPSGFFLLPGIEYLTKEGIDINIFSDSKKIYDYPELKPRRMNYKETVNFILKNNLSAYVTHPYTLGLTSVINKLGRQKYLEYVNKLGAVEVSVDSFSNLYQLLKKPILKNIFKKKIKRIEKNITLPKEDYPRTVKFLTAGSDAHHPEDLGAYITIEAEPQNLYKSIISNTSPQITKKNYNSPHYFLLAKEAAVSFKEFLKRLLLKMRLEIS